jgi:hypothetical protein
MPPTAGQVEPEPVHRPCTQQPLSLHALPGQHASPAPPHDAHTPLLQARLEPLQVWPPQQASPAPPQAAQVPPP